jgi:hypothetical protein
MPRGLEADLAGDEAVAETGVLGLALKVMVLEVLPIVQVVENAVDGGPRIPGSKVTLGAGLGKERPFKNVYPV